MTGIKKIIAVLFFISLGVAGYATDSLSSKVLTPRQLKLFAKHSVKQGDYNAGVHYYERYLKIKRNDYKSAYMLAECYRNIRDYKNAETWYKTAYDKSNKTYKPPLYYYAQMLKANGDYKLALEMFQKFKKESSGDASSKPLVKQLKQDIAGCDSAVKLMEKPAKLMVIHMDTTINKVNVESAPLALDESTIIYSSLRTDKKEYYVSDDTTNNPSRKFYMAKKENGQWAFKGEYSGPFNEQGVNVGNGALSVDGKRFYFTKCKKNWQNKMICAIYVSRFENGQWQEPEMLDKRINNPKYTSTQPTVAIESVKKNEVIYFVSDRPKGKGGLDIWYTIYDIKKKTYREPRNAGTKINTSQDEMTPFYDSDKRLLYFSSNGWAGMGGQDVYRTRGELNKWQPAGNLGVPVNSSADDLYYAEGKNKEEGFFVSNRKGGVSLKSPTCCDDLYSFKRLEYIHMKTKGVVTECKEELNNKPIENATVSLYLLESKGEEPVFIKSIEGGSEGDFKFDLEPGQNYKITTTKDGYLASQATFSTKKYTESKEIELKLCMEQIPKGAIVLKNIYYDTDKADLKEGAKTTIDTTLLNILNNNPDIIIEISSHTDYRGSDNYNLKLSQRRAESVVNYLISKGIAKERLVAKGYGETQPLAPNKNADGTDNVEGMDKNRRTEFRIIGQIPRTEVDYQE